MKYLFTDKKKKMFWGVGEVRRVDEKCVYIYIYFIDIDSIKL